MKLALIALALCGCNDLLSLDPGTPLDPEVPSCLTGWQSRIPIDIVSATPLTDFQVQAPWRAPVTDDLRFVDGDGALLRYAVEGETIWINVPTLVAGTTRIYAYSDNPSAPAWVGGTPFMEGVLANHSFENAGAWNLDAADQVDTVFRRTSEWASDGVDSMFADEEVSGSRIRRLTAAIATAAVLPEGSTYVIRFDLHVIAASYSVTQTTSGPSYGNSGGFFIDLGNGLEPSWQLVAHGNITGLHLAEESAPIGPGTTQIRFGTLVDNGTGPGYAKGYVDNFRVRKVATAALEVSVGAREDACD